MKFKKIVIWSLLTKIDHHLLENATVQTIEASLSLLSIFCPGKNSDGMYNPESYNRMLEGDIRPRLRKLFPELLEVDADSINQEDMLEVAEHEKTLLELACPNPSLRNMLVSYEKEESTKKK